MAAIGDWTSARAYLTTTVRRPPSARSRLARTVAAIWPVPTGSVVTARTADAVPVVPRTASNHAGVSCVVSSTMAGSGRTPPGVLVAVTVSDIGPPRAAGERRVPLACTVGGRAPP